MERILINGFPGKKRWVKIAAWMLLLALASFPVFAINTPTFTPTLTPFVTETATPTVTPTYIIQSSPKNNLFLSSNVFNPSTGQSVTINFSIAQAGNVVINIYNIAGLRVRSFNEPGLQPDILYTSLSWDGMADDGMIVASGVYYIKLTSGTAFDCIKKVIVLKR